MRLDLMRWITLFLCLSVDGDTPPADDQPPADGAPPADDAPPVDDVQADGNDDAPPTKEEIQEARRQATEAREEARRAREEADALRRAPPPAARNTEEERIRAEEDRILADPASDENAKWRVNSNRTLRASQADAALARFQAQDTADRTSFQLACADNPRLKAVKDQVEAEVSRLRQSGQNAPRESIAYFLLGKMVATAKPKAKPKNDAPASGVDRSRPASARSDVGGRRPLTERDKRRSRLENVPL